VIDKVPAQSIVSHDLTGWPLNFKSTLKLFDLSSFQDATTSSPINSWLSFMLIISHQNMLISYWFTVISGALLILSCMAALLTFHAASLTLTFRVHSSLRVVPDVTGFQFSDSSTLQFLVVSSDHETATTFPI